MIVKILANLFRIVLGAVLIFSGFTKGVDPMGATIKFSDYFHAFHLDFMTPIALPLAVLLNGAEFLIGVALLFNVWMKFTGWVALLFMSFFTILTFLLAVFNPVSDCGCFGDAIKLTNWETFYKNILLIIFAITIFIYRKEYSSSINQLGQLIIVIITSASFIWFSFYCYAHLPIIDFRPFKMGTYIPDQMTVPKGAPLDSFSTVLVYEHKKTGELKDFAMDSIPWQDSLTWKWRETKNKLVREGAKPPIHDFNIVDKNQEDITSMVLNDSSFSFIAVIPKIEQANSLGLKKLELISNFCKKSNQYKFYALCASTPETMEKYRSENNLTFECYTTDATPLKTMVRSNPGLLLIKQGTVLGLWAYRDIPELNEQTKNLYSLIGETNRKKEESHKTLSLFYAFFLLLAVASNLFTKKQKHVGKRT